MTTIDPANTLALAMQAQLAALRERGRVGNRRSAEGAQGTAHTARAFAQRIQHIAPDDPERRQKAVRVFLEGELVREFGDSLLTDPQFPTMLDAIQHQMQQDTSVAAAVQALGDLLLAGKAP